MSLTDSTPLEAAKSASIASRTLATLSVEDRNDALLAIHDALKAGKDEILQANRRDLQTATKAAQDGELSQSVVKRLDLSRPGKFADMLTGILDVRALPDPVGQITLRTELDDGLELERITCPIGVLLIIFEARPEVIANIASLAVKSGNSAILKGGKESTESFQTISRIISHALSSTKVPNAAIQLVKTRDVIDQLLALDTYIDLVIPRGSNELVRYIKSHTKIPVLGHADGLCSIYIHADAPLEQTVHVVVDSKTGYPAACNAVETLLVHEAVLSSILTPVAEALLAKGVSLRCDEQSLSVLTSTLPAHLSTLLQPATDADYNTEFLDLTLAIKTISASAGVADAIAHINTHSSHHTDAIMTASADAADAFLRGVDSAGVYWNASTRMADGTRYGFGTEVGISTNKIHSRGPVGLEGLTIYKYLLRGNGHAAGDYGGAGGKQWKHKRLPLESD